MAKNNKPESNNINIAFALPESWLNVIQKDAKREDRSVSYIIRRIIKKSYKFK